MSEGGLGKYSPDLFDEHEMADYRTRFPEETRGLSDEQIFNVVSAAEDDHDNDGWKAAFKAAT